ncbi:MAG TPA: hypothetical protein DCM54_13650, partial [Gammaproteobacteria bacterium]|nr:hypothetical protein [Gammaproteobacteria bacterium]
MSKLMGIFRLFLLLGLCFPALAAEWNDLTTEQRKVLAPYEDQWSEFSEQRQSQLAKGAARWAEMNEKSREETRQRF